KVARPPRPGAVRRRRDLALPRVVPDRVEQLNPPVRFAADLGREIDLDAEQLFRLHGRGGHHGETLQGPLVRLLVHGRSVPDTGHPQPFTVTRWTSSRCTPTAGPM